MCTNEEVSQEKKQEVPISRGPWARFQFPFLGSCISPKDYVGDKRGGSAHTLTLPHALARHLCYPHVNL